MNAQHFNATQELEEIRQRRAVKRRKTYHRSCLQKYRAEILALQNAAASLREISEWLRTKKHLKISHTTIRDFTKKISTNEEEACPASVARKRKPNAQ